MSDAAYYRGEALRFLQFARTAREAAVRRRGQRLADDYVTLAAQLDAQGRAPLLRFSEPQASNSSGRRRVELGTPISRLYCVQ